MTHATYDLTILTFFRRLGRFRGTPKDHLIPLADTFQLAFVEFGVGLGFFYINFLWPQKLTAQYPLLVLPLDVPIPNRFLLLLVGATVRSGEN